MEYTGSRYDGPQESGRAEGVGTYVFPNGTRYVGGLRMACSTARAPCTCQAVAPTPRNGARVGRSLVIHICRWLGV